MEDHRNFQLFATDGQTFCHGVRLIVQLLRNLLDPLRAVTGEDWIPGKRYKVRGFWVADAKTMCFDLNEGVQEDFRPVTPNNDAE